MRAEIITIGDEILIGQILDSNSKWIAEELNKIGVSVFQITSIQDDKKQIKRALDHALENSGIVILTGGLGPTNDDMTKHTITEYFGDQLILDEDVVNRIKHMFKKANYPFTQVNRDQALIPSTCIPLINNWGTAPGMWFHRKEGLVISLPGVPNEMKGIMTESVLKMLKETFDLPVIIHKTVQTYGMGESMVAERIQHWENKLPKEIKLGYLPSYGKLRLRLTASGTKAEKLNQLLESAIKELFEIIPDIIVGIGEEESIEAQIGELMRKTNRTLAVAESCTGGAISSRITKIAGASKFFKGGIIAYDAGIKMQELGVAPSIIKKHSVVSAQVAEAMAQGIQIKYKTDYGIATTGNAGPTSDVTDQTIGTVFIAIASPKQVFSIEFFFGKPREKVIERTANKALELLRKEILKNK